MELTNDSSLYLIPTAGKDKIAHTHSYPIGAEALSRALADMPQVREIILSFTAGRFFSFSGEWAHRHNLAGDVIWTVLRVRYRRRSSSLASQWEYGLRPGVTGPQWWVDVYPVERTVRHSVREALESALPELCVWLLANSCVDARLGELEFIFTYNETEKKISPSVTEKLEPNRMR